MQTPELPWKPPSRPALVEVSGAVRSRTSKNGFGTLFASQPMTKMTISASPIAFRMPSDSAADNARERQRKGDVAQRKPAIRTHCE